MSFRSPLWHGQASCSKTHPKQSIADTRQIFILCQFSRPRARARQQTVAALQSYTYIRNLRYLYPRLQFRFYSTCFILEQFQRMISTDEPLYGSKSSINIIIFHKWNENFIVVLDTNQVRLLFRFLPRMCTYLLRLACIYYISMQNESEVNSNNK